MSFKIQSPPNPIRFEALGKTETAASPEAKAKEDAKRVGREFEAILVRQMLSTTKIAGKGGGYGDMAVESLANAITAAGGLGMGRAIEDAIHETRAAHTAKTPESRGISGEPGAPRK